MSIMCTAEQDGRNTERAAIKAMHANLAYSEVIFSSKYQAYSDYCVSMEEKTWAILNFKILSLF